MHHLHLFCAAASRQFCVIAACTLALSAFEIIVKVHTLDHDGSDATKRDVEASHTFRSPFMVVNADLKADKLSTSRCI